MWQRAAKNLTIDDGDAFPLTYTIPKCSVRYAMRSVVLAEVAGGRPPAGVEILAEIVGNPDTDRLTWQLVGLRSFLLHDGERRERPATRTKWPPTLVFTDGASWREARGPSTLWAAFSVVPPLVSQFPILPEDGTLGASYRWNVQTYAKRTTSKVEQRRIGDPDADIPNLVPESYEVAVALAEWQRLTWSSQGEQRSVRAAVLRGSWSRERTDYERIERHSAERWRGRWVVTETGRLLHAIAMAGRYQWWAISSEEHNSKLSSTEIELRLIEDCDTPTLPRFLVKSD